MVATLLVLVTALGLAAAAWFYRNRMRPLAPLAQVHPKAHLPTQPVQTSVTSASFPSSKQRLPRATRSASSPWAATSSLPSR